MPHSVLAILILLIVVCAFVLQKFPVSVAALLGALAMMAFGILTPSEAISSFGSDAVIMVAGVMVIGNAVFESGLAERLGDAILRFRPAARSERCFMVIILALIAFLSAFMSNTAAVAMFMPLVSSVARASKGRIKKKNLFMAMGIASILGGNCTLAGSTPQLTAQGILENTPGVRTLTFFELAYIGVPLVLLMLFYYATVGATLQEKVFLFPEPVEEGPGREIRENRDTGHKALLSGIILLSCMAAFAAGVFSLGTVALLGACLCILTGCITCRKAFQSMDWSTITVLAGAMGFSKGLQKSGAVDLIAERMLALFGGPEANPALMCAALIILASILGNVMSHTATVAVLTPIAISLAAALSTQPITYVIGVVIGSNLAFATPIATPPLTMTLCAGYRFLDYSKVGGALNVVTVLFAAAAIPVIYGL